jgi:hypothetical protein
LNLYLKFLVMMGPYRYLGVPEAYITSITYIAGTITYINRGGTYITYIGTYIAYIDGGDGA